MARGRRARGAGGAAAAALLAAYCAGAAGAGAGTGAGMGAAGPAHLRPAVQVWQTGSTSLDDPEAPQLVVEKVRNMTERNPEAEFHFLDDAAQRAWVVKHFPRDVVDAYDDLPLAVMRADLWRYMVVLKEGGLYADSDVLVTEPFAEWEALDPAMGCEVVIGLENDFHLCQWAIFSLRPHHPLLDNVVSFVLRRIMEGSRKSLKWTELLRLDEPVHFVHEYTGPKVWTQGVLDYFGLDWDVSAHPTLAREFLDGDWMGASGAWSGTRIESNGAKGMAFSPASTVGGRAAGSGAERPGTVCVFERELFAGPEGSPPGGTVLTNGFYSIVNTTTVTPGTDRKWGSWQDSRGELILKSRIRATFRTLDRNGDGKLTLDELQALKELLPQMARLLPSKHSDRSDSSRMNFRGSNQEGDIYRGGRFNVKDDVADRVGDPVALLLEADLDGDGALSMEELTARLDGHQPEGGQPRGSPPAKWGRPLVGAAGVAAVAALAAALTRASPARRRRRRPRTSAPARGGGGLSAFLHTDKSK